MAMAEEEKVLAQLEDVVMDSAKAKAIVDSAKITMGKK